MKNKVFQIINSAGINDAACCAFSKVKDHLLNCRALQRIPQNSKTIIMCAFPYKVFEEKPQNISRYAAVPDYHEVAGGYLSRAVEHLRSAFPQNSFEFFLDNSPIPEVFAAATAGLGVRGDNGLLITKKYGSWVFLGEILTDLELECEEKYAECLHCGACAAACPKIKEQTDCLSAVSQKKRELEQKEIDALRNYGILWGCDICSEVCPMNKGVKIAPLPEFAEHYRNCYTCGEDIAHRAYAWRGERVIKRNYEIVNSK